MYYVVTRNIAYGPFISRYDAYYFASTNGGLDKCFVKSDRVMQNEYLHLPIMKPE